MSAVDLQRTTFKTSRWRRSPTGFSTVSDTARIAGGDR
jgi:hypothetical protein